MTTTTSASGGGVFFDVFGGRPLPNCPYASSSLPPAAAPAAALQQQPLQQPLPPFPPGSSSSAFMLALPLQQQQQQPQPQQPLPLQPQPQQQLLFHNPAISASFLGISLAAFVFAALTLARFDQVRIFNRRIAHPSVRNREYAALFFLLSASFAIDAVRYILDLPHAPRPSLALLATPPSAWLAPSPNSSLPPLPPLPLPHTPASSIVGPHVIDAWLLMASALLRSAAVFVLALALNQQRKHRSLAIDPPPRSPSRRDSFAGPPRLGTLGSPNRSSARHSAPARTRQHQQHAQHSGDESNAPLLPSHLPIYTSPLNASLPAGASLGSQSPAAALGAAHPPHPPLLATGPGSTSGSAAGSATGGVHGNFGPPFRRSLASPSRSSSGSFAASAAAAASATPSGAVGLNGLPAPGITVAVPPSLGPISPRLSATRPGGSAAGGSASRAFGTGSLGPQASRLSRRSSHSSLEQGSFRDDSSVDYTTDADHDDDDAATPLLGGRRPRLLDWPSIWFYKIKDSTRAFLRQLFFNWEFVFVLLFLAKITGMLLVVDPAAFIDDSLVSGNGSFDLRSAATNVALNSDDARFIAMGVLSALQFIPLLIMLFCIVTGSSQPPQRTQTSGRPSRRARRRQGPAILTKCLFCISVLMMSVWWIEPSLVSRAIEQHIQGTMDPQTGYEGSVCVVPPWWWLEVPRNTSAPTMPDGQLLPSEAFAATAMHRGGSDRIGLNAHGWASWVDVSQWVGMAGLWILFLAMRAEFKRNMEEWVWVTVSEVQNTFDFRR
ncbi:hypothetical protein BC831DRAFT_516105 [Entophlyctis helioformis]|nr:hypothetical protein BC831DRAFT_516105 [Entophlyctis helioformis]